MERPAVGVLGIGAMGSPIAGRLIRHAGRIRVFDTDSAAMARAEALQFETSRSVADLAREVDVLVTVLPGSAELADLVADPESMTAYLRAGALWIDLTSAAPGVLRRCDEICRSLGIRFVAAPMRGSVEDARNGTLGFWVAGAQEDVDAARSILHALGGPEAVTVVGHRPEDAATVKLLSNLLWFGQVVATTEALLLGQSVGIAPERLSALLRDGPGGGAYLDHHVEALLDGDYLESFPLERIVEELALVSDLAKDTGTPFELSALVLDLHERARVVRDEVDGELSVARLLERQAGAVLRRPSL